MNHVIAILKNWTLPISIKMGTLVFLMFHCIKCATAMIESSIDVARNYRQYALQAGVPESWILKIEEEINDRIASL